MKVVVVILSVICFTQGRSEEINESLVMANIDLLQNNDGLIQFAQEKSEQSYLSQNFLEKQDTHNLQTVIKINNIQAICGYQKESQIIYVAFRGTNNFSNLITNLRFFKDDYICKGCKVHKGFKKAFDSVYDSIKSFIYKISEKYPINKLLFTGHSLGGALAHIASVQEYPKFSKENIHQQIILITFGQPRVGNSEFAQLTEQLQIKALRFVNQLDPVPRLPPQIFGYQHLQPEYWINGQFTHKCSHPTNYEQCRIKEKKIRLKDHYISNYSLTPSDD